MDVTGLAVSVGTENGLNIPCQLGTMPQGAFAMERSLAQSHPQQCGQPESPIVSIDELNGPWPPPGYRQCSPHDEAASSMIRKRLPRALNPQRVGKYPAASFAGGGYVWDAVLEYRVWCCPAAGAPDEDNGNDYYFAFSNYPRALQFSQAYEGADDPIALILQLEYIDEPRKGKYVHVKRRRITEWPVEFLSRPKRNKNTIPDFLSPSAPENRLDIIRGLAKKPRPAAQARRGNSSKSVTRRRTKP